MRIISQDSYTDVNYDNCMLETCYDGLVIVGYFGDQGRTMAEYSTAEKTQKAMKMLHDAYRDEHSAEMGENGIIYGRNYIFRFPQDSEV